MTSQFYTLYNLIEHGDGDDYNEFEVQRYGIYIAGCLCKTFLSPFWLNRDVNSLKSDIAPSTYSLDPVICHSDNINGHS